MTATTTPPVPTRALRRLPRWVPWALMAASVALAAGILALGDGPTPAGTAFLGALIFVVATGVTSWIVEGERYAKDRLATTLVSAAFLLALLPLLSLVWTVLRNGLEAFGWSFLTTDMVGIFGQMTEGGIYHAIIGTLYVTGFACLISIPLGIFTAIYLVEYGQGPISGRIKRGITVLVDVMTGIPSIVAGLFAYSVFLLIFDEAYRSALVGGVALAVLMTPVVVRSCEEMLRLVPNELREASYALGVPKWLTIVKVVLRTSVAGITTGVMIAIARVTGETAPLLITIGFVNNVNYDAFDGRIASLPVYVFREYAQGGQASHDRAWAAALTLIAIVMLLFLLARLVSKFFSPKLAR